MEATAAKRDIVTIGGSAGAVDVVKTIVRSLPADFGAAVFIIVHTSPRLPSHMPDILNRVGPLHVCHAAEGDAIVPGQIYLAPPDRHLIVAENHIHITRGPREGLHRPSINMTFRSAAGAYRERVVGVLLSGMLDDGASGMWEIARHGGVTVVQNPAEAQFPSMPLSALHDVPVDYEARAEEMGPLLNGLVSGTNISEMRLKVNGPGSPELFSGLTCAECRGPLWNRKGGPEEFPFGQNTRAIRRLRLSSMINVLPCAIDSTGHACCHL